MVIKYIIGRNNRRADIISQRPNLIRDLTDIQEDPPTLKTNDQGDLISMEVLINILISIIKNPTEMENFKEAYLEDPRLEDQEDDLRFSKDDQEII